MQAVKIIFLVIAIISVPALTIFLIRLAMKLSLGVDHLNRTLDDARPQLNMLLSNLNHTVEDINEEMERITQMTGEAEEMVKLTESSLRSVEGALRSPVARLGGIMAGFATTTFLFRGMMRRLDAREKQP